MSNGSSRSLAWRPMLLADIPAVVRIAAAVHAAFPERDEVFAERLRLAPEGCHVAVLANSAVGYVLSHPWTAGAPPALDTLLESLPRRPECWYLHDLALLGEARGSGLGQHIVRHLKEVASGEGLSRMELVAVSGSGPFWSGQGFRAIDFDRAKLASYGDDARLMACSFTKAPGG